MFIFTFFRELFDVTLRLLVNLTNPELLLFKEELPEDKETRNYYLQIQVHTYLYIYSFSLHRAGDILLSLLNRWAVGNRFLQESGYETRIVQLIVGLVGKHCK